MAAVLFPEAAIFVSGVSVSTAEAFWMKVVYWVLCCEASMVIVFILVEFSFVWVDDLT